MARAFLSKELYAEAKDETGLLGRITIALKEQDVYIIHLSAYSVGQTGYLQMVTKDNKKAKEIIKHFIPKADEREVLIVEFENKVGTLAHVAKLLGSNGIRIDYVYGTSGDGFKIAGVFSTEDNARAAEIINKDSGALGLS
jgi:hypothetical protein